MAARPKVLLIGNIDHALDAWSGIKEIADVVKPKATNRAELLEECKTGAFDGASVAYRTFPSFPLTGNFDAELLDALPSTLKFICNCGAGYDQINIAACTERSIRVSNTPTAVDDSTADITIWLLLGALRNFPVGLTALREGKWRGNPAPKLGHDPQGKVLGILGMGGIGRNVAVKARAFDMKIRYYNRTRLAPEVEAEAGNAEYVDFDTLLRESDVLSLNLPLNPKTHHTISKDQFALMKDGVVIVNTARGAVMDEAALVDALQSGKVASAGLDVYEDEPKVHQGLIDDPRVLLVPHMGTWTVETLTKMENWTLDNVRMALEKAKLKSIVPEQKDME